MEKALIEAVLNKKKSAFSIFYNDIVDHFFSFLKSSYNLSNEEINDIIADTFIKIWTKLDSFNKDKWDFLNWCWTILRNTAKDYFKSKKDIAFSQLTSDTEEGNNFEDSLQDDTDILDELEKEYEVEQIKKALNLLKPDEREIIFLRFSEWKQLDEIAQIMWLSYANARVKLHRTLKKLKNNLQNV